MRLPKVLIAIASTIALVASAAAIADTAYFRFGVGYGQVDMVGVESDVYYRRIGQPAEPIYPFSRLLVANPAWRVLSGVLPAGLAIASDSGEISGTPTTLGEYTIALEQRDTSGRVHGRTPEFKIVILPQLTDDATFDRYSIRAGVYHETNALAANGDGRQLVFSSENGELPPAMTIDPITGIISGVPGPGHGSYSTDIRVTDPIDSFSAISSVTTLQYVEPIKVEPVPVIRVRAGAFFESDPLPYDPATVYGAVEWSLVEGVLPDIVSLDRYTGVIYGTPPEPGVHGDLVFEVKDVGSSARTEPTSIEVLDDVTLEYATEAEPVLGMPFVSSPPAVGNLIGDADFDVASGALPSGLVLRGDGVISGTPAVDTGTFAATVRVTDSFDGSTATAQVTFSPLPRIQLGAVTTPRFGRIGAAFQIASPGYSRNRGEVSWSIASGTLPDGLNLNPDGSISGVPLQEQDQTGIVLKAEDGFSSDLSNQITIKVAGELRLSYGPFEDPILRTWFSIGPPTVRGLVGAASYSLASGSLPPGLALGSDGSISGTVGVGEGKYIATIQVRDSFDGVAAVAEVEFEPTPDIQISLIGSAHVGRAQSPFLSPVPTINNALGDVTWSVVTGTLPDGIQINQATGQLSGTPSTVGVTSGIVVQVTDGKSTARSGAISFNIVGPLNVLYSAATPYRGKSYNSGSPVMQNRLGTATYRSVSGSLPPGLSLDTAGGISGTPSVNSGTYSVVIEGTDSYDEKTALVAVTLQPQEPAPEYYYLWYSGSYSSCSATCGGGTRTRTVYCTRSDIYGSQVSDALCGAAGPRPASTSSCNTQQCPLVWGTNGTASCRLLTAADGVNPICYNTCGGFIKNGISCKTTWRFFGVAGSGASCAPVAGHPSEVRGWTPGGTSFTCYGVMQ